MISKIYCYGIMNIIIINFNEQKNWYLTNIVQGYKIDQNDVLTPI